ncbi:hypothetical protein QA599_20115 [Haloarculaceae archaeon H-GB1-1]|nr:hypothetical protein [Haloarculaceae archaeon H-GB1-1]
MTASRHKTTRHVPAPLPPDDPEAWYAPAVLSQYSVHPDVVVTISRTATGFGYDVRKPQLTGGDEAARRRVEYYALARVRCLDQLTPYALDDRIDGALLWLRYEAHGVVLFSGPAGVGKTTLMNAVSREVPVQVCGRDT